MPKMKTKSGAAKRFKKTANGFNPSDVATVERMLRVR